MQRWIIVGVAALVLSTTGIITFFVMKSNADARAFDEAQSTAVGAHNAYVAAVDALKSAADEGEIIFEGSEARVADETTRETLANKLAIANETVALALARGSFDVDTKMGISAVVEVAQSADTATADIVQARESLEAATNAVGESMVTLSMTNLDKALVDAEKTLTDSKGKVADEKTRDTLSKSIKDAHELTDDVMSGAMSGSDVSSPADRADALDTTTSELKKNTKAVKDSVAAKAEADKKAAEQAAEEQATPESTSDSGGYTEDTYSDDSWFDSGSTWTNNGGGGEYTPPVGGGGYTGGDRFPDTVTDSDGNIHHQITPDENGSYTGPEKPLW